MQLKLNKLCGDTGDAAIDQAVKLQIVRLGGNQRTGISHLVGRRHRTFLLCVNRTVPTILRASMSHEGQN